MDSVERVTKVLRGELPDRVPVGLHCYLMACRMQGGQFDEILRDGEEMAEAQLKAWRTFGHDVLMLENGVCAEAEALGCVIRYTVDGPPHVEEPLLKDLDDIEKLRVPDPERTFPLAELLKTTRIVKQETGGKVFINGPGCALPADTPEANVQALMECVRSEGTYGADGRPLAK